MKKLILFFLIPFTMVMADFTLAGQTLTPVNEDETTTPVTTSSIPTATRTYTTTGSAKTNWGFQPFTVPSDSVTVPAGGDIQAAINSMPEGGTVYLKAGIYNVQNLQFRTSNIVLQGEGVDKTILKTKSGQKTVFTHCNNFDGCVENLILRDFKVDANGNGGITFAWGPSNLLFENIEVSHPGDSGITVNNNNWKYNGHNVTFRNIYIHNSGMHGFDVRFTKGIVIDNYRAHDLKQGIDISSCKYAEISNITVERALWGGMKFPSISHLYMHDVNIKDCNVLGIKLQEGTKYLPTEPQHLHLQNVTVENSGAGIVWIGTENLKYDPPVIDMVVENVKLVNNRDNWDNITNKPIDPYGKVHTQIRMNIKIQDLYEYGDNIDITDTHPINYHKFITGNPKDQGVGWRSWPALFN